MLSQEANDYWMSVLDGDPEALKRLDFMLGDEVPGKFARVGRFVFAESDIRELAAHIDELNVAIAVVES